MAWSWATDYGDPARQGGIPRRAGSGGGNPLHERVLQLQATAGNAAVQQLVAERGSETGSGDAGKATGQRTTTKPEILRYGSRGEGVKRLQEALNQYGGLEGLKVDGIFGPLTKQAVRQFQKLHPPLDVDGRVGPETWAELQRVGNEGAPMPGATARDFYDKGRKLYQAGRYALAFDEFAKAYGMDRDLAYLFNMAQSLWLSGGRNAEALKLYEQFIAAGPGEAGVARAKEQIEKLRGPAPTGDRAKDQAAADEISAAARKLFTDAEFGRAYDEYTKAYALTHDPSLLYNRASALRAMGGQRSQAMALLEQFLATDVSDDMKATARQEIKELRGAGATGDEKKDTNAQQELYLDARLAFESEDYGHAYDLFSKAYEVAHDPAFLWNRAQSLRLMGGRREEAIKLYQQFESLDLPEDIKKAARVHIAELRGPDQVTGAGKPH